MNKTDIIDNYPMLKCLKIYLSDINGFIAGGCFRSIFDGITPKDADLFFRNETDFNSAKDAYAAKEWKIIYENKNVTGLYKKGLLRVDLVRSIYGTPEEVISRFDFSVSKFAMDKEKVIHAENYWRDLHLKRLVCDEGIPMPIGTFERAQRYAKYGYFMCRETKVKLLTAIQSANQTSIEELNKSLYQGWD